MPGILRIVLLAVAAMFFIRWLRKRMGQAGERPAEQGTQWPGTRKTDAPGRGKLKLLRFGSDPLKVLGLDSSASEEEIAAAYAVEPGQVRISMDL